MFSLFLLPFFHLANFRVIVSTTACTCDNTTNLCDSPCSISNRKIDRLPRCPSGRAFLTDAPLVDWLLSDLFCVYSDHRLLALDEFSNSFVPENTPINLTSDFFASSGSTNATTASTDYNYGDAIVGTVNGAQSNVFLPSPAANSMDCTFTSRPIEFFVPVEGLKCNVNASTADTDFVFPTQITTNGQNVQVTISDGTDTTTPPRYIRYSFLYDNATRLITQVNLSVLRYEATVVNQNLDVEVSVRFYTDPSRINSLKAGEFGYANGQNVIVKKINSAQNEYFPIPYAADCSNNAMDYTPLTFGDDTMTGCLLGANGTPIDLLLQYTNISRLGQANPLNNLDWVEITRDPVNVTNACTNLRLIISYEFIGNVNNPQNRIYAARFECSPVTSQFFMFTTQFLHTAGNNAERYLPPEPIPGIPNDTFYPMIRV